MLCLNRQGEDARTTLQIANPGAPAARDVQWLTDDILLVLHYEGSLWMTIRDTGFTLRSAVKMVTTQYSMTAPPQPWRDLTLIRAGGHSWIGQVQEAHSDGSWDVDYRVMGELGKNKLPFPMEHSQDAIITDVARENGAVLVMQLRALATDTALTLIASGKEIEHIHAPHMKYPARIAPNGEAVSWIAEGSLRDVQSWVNGGRGTYPLPGHALATPRIFDFFDQWWVLAFTAECGLTLTPCDDATTGYQWPVFDAASFDAFLTDQVYVKWQTELGEILTSDGFAPGMDPQPIMPLPDPLSANVIDAAERFTDGALPMPLPDDGKAPGSLPEIAGQLMPEPDPCPGCGVDLSRNGSHHVDCRHADAGAFHPLSDARYVQGPPLPPSADPSADLLMAVADLHTQLQDLQDAVEITRARVARLQQVVRDTHEAVELPRALTLKIGPFRLRGILHSLSVAADLTLDTSSEIEGESRS